MQTKNGYLITGDWHVRSLTPRMRKEEQWWTEVLKPKISYIVNYAKQNNLTIYFTGDLVDSAGFNSLFVLNELKELLKDADIISIPGNHDIIARDFDSLSRTAYYNIGLESHSDFVIHEVTEQLPNKSDILMIHRFVANDFCPDFIESCINVKELIDLYPNYKYYFIGDNHTSWSIEIDEKIIINSGSITRNSINQKDYKPCFYTIVNNKIKKHLIPIRKEVWKSEDDVSFTQIDTTELTDSFKDLPKDKFFSFKDLIKVLLKDHKHLESTVAKYINL